MRSAPAAARRAWTVRRHRLDGSAASPEQVATELLALHATDPASVYLSVLARASEAALDDVHRAMYERRSLVRWLAMRRTLFVFPRELIPSVQAAVSGPLAGMLRRQLVSVLVRNGLDPPFEGDAGAWIARVEGQTADALRARGDAIGAQLSADVPALRSAIPPRIPSESSQNVTSRLLALMSAEGRIVRSIPSGAWTTRQHRWEPVEAWFPGGVPAGDPDVARVELARAWLDAFGPALPEDLEWWTGWTKTAMRSALAQLELIEVDLDGRPGIALADEGWWSAFDAATTDGVATLLPSLDPTAMGWKERDWYLSVPREEIFDRAGNIGPTVWWDGEIIGSWAVAADGSIRTVIRVDRGSDAAAAVEDAAARLTLRLEGAMVNPVCRTPLERSLVLPRPIAE